ncbi:MAG: response regulator [Candidatus Aceula meridiana]|nr:response regulator [Candidatus Aceula meridiana]
MNNSDTQRFIEFTPKVPVLDLKEQGAMLSDFTTESLELLMDAKNAILTLETVPNDLQALNNAFKVFYTITGLAEFLNLHDIQRLTKDAEELFDLWRKGLLVFDAKLIEVSLEVVDTTRKLLDALHEQLSEKGEIKDYVDITPVLKTIYNVKRNIQLDDAQETKKKSSKKVMPIKMDDSRANLMKRQQELVQERELAMRLSQQAQREASEKGEMLASMSHEMRTLINAILGFSDLLIKSPLEDKQKEFLSSIHSSGELLLEIINNILDLAKVERGKIKFEKVGFHFEELIEDVFRIIRTRLEGKPIALFYDIDLTVPLGLKGDPTRLRQILINLLNNSVKFTKKGEIGLKVSLAEKSLKNETTLLFRVSDTGIGIPKSRQNFIFEPFTQGDNSVSREYGGTGLGLTISRSYVEAMGGKLWVESEEGKGSNFIFSMSFPLDKASGQRKISKLPAKALSEKTAFIVDKDTRGALQGCCEHYKIKTTLAEGDSKQIFNDLQKQANSKQGAPDIIFIDILTGREDSYLLASKVRNDELLKTTKIIAVAADIRMSVSSEAYEQCFDDFLLRPILHGEFLSVIQKSLGIKFTEEIKSSDGEKDDVSCEGIKVLIVDDSPTNIELIKAYFESIGCKGSYAVNGQEAIEKIRENEYDICFMDLQMPVLNGYAAAQIIRDEISKDLPIVALTAADISEDRERCMQIGFNDFLMKPFDMDEFQGKIIQYGKRI